MVAVENVTIVPISTVEELNSMIQRGSEQRHTSGTQMNDESSRSHLILSIVIESTNLQSQSTARGKVLLYITCILPLNISMNVNIPYSSFILWQFETQVFYDLEALQFF